VKLPSPLPTLVVELLNEGFDIAWQRWREEIGEYSGEFIDSQEREFNI
jgi:hypothetical protein